MNEKRHLPLFAMNFNDANKTNFYVEKMPESVVLFLIEKIITKSERQYYETINILWSKNSLKQDFALLSFGVW